MLCHQKPSLQFFISVRAATSSDICEQQSTLSMCLCLCFRNKECCICGCYVKGALQFSAGLSLHNKWKSFLQHLFHLDMLHQKSRESIYTVIIFRWEWKSFFNVYTWTFSNHIKWQRRSVLQSVRKVFSLLSFFIFQLRKLTSAY